MKFRQVLLALSAIALVMGRSTAAPDTAKTLPLIATSGNSTHLSPQQSVRQQKAQTAVTIYKEAVLVLKSDDFATAENYFRESLLISPDGPIYLGLAEALTAQGRFDEATQAYQKLFHPGPGISFGGSYFTRARLEYALLLNETNQWAEAVSLYETTLPNLPDKGMAKIGIHFDINTPQPTTLEAATNIALGLDATWNCDALGGFEHDRAFQHYTKALQLAPGWVVANYYYGYGWKNLDPKGVARRANAAQAKAAFQQAATYGEGNVKEAAEQALQGFK
jgi:tetratricopeptide (TPR) repeat protein